MTQLSKFDVSAFFLSDFVGIIPFLPRFSLSKSTVLTKNCQKKSDGSCEDYYRVQFTPVMFSLPAKVQVPSLRQLQ